MLKVKLETPVLKSNDELAAELRAMFDEKRVFVLNLMSSPGSGKTTLIEAMVDHWDGSLKVGVIEGDLATSRDAERIAAKGVRVVQINTKGACHLDAKMISNVLGEFRVDDLDLLIIENVGNLVCPASYDLGEDARVVVLSTTEGNDKVAKYPVIFRKASAIVLNKLDLAPYTDFDIKVMEQDLAQVNPDLERFYLSARTKQGVAEWCEWVKRKVEEKKGAAGTS